MHTPRSMLLGALAILVPALAGPAAAADACPTAGEVEKTISRVFKRDISVTAVVPSRLEGFCEVQVSFQGRPNILYTDGSGAYLLTGRLIDAKAGVDLTEESLAALNAFSAEEMKKVATLATITLGSTGDLPVWLVVLVILRDLVIVGGAAAYLILVDRFDAEPTLISKANTVMQLVLVLVVVARAAWGMPTEEIVNGCIAVTALTTVASGAGYMVTWGFRARARSGNHHAP